MHQKYSFKPFGVVYAKLVSPEQTVNMDSLSRPAAVPKTPLVFTVGNYQCCSLWPVLPHLEMLKENRLTSCSYPALSHTIMTCYEPAKIFQKNKFCEIRHSNNKKSHLLWCPFRVAVSNEEGCRNRSFQRLGDLNFSLFFFGKKNKNKKWGCSTDTQKQSCGWDSVLGCVYCGPAEVQLSFKILSRSKARWFLTSYFIVYCSEQSLWDALVLSAASCDFSVTSYAAQALVQGAFHFKFYRTH